MQTPHLFAWADLTPSDVQRCRICASQPAVLRATVKELAAVLHSSASVVDNNTSEEIQEIEMDMLYYAVHHALGWGFSDEKISSFFTLLRLTHALAMSSPLDNMQEVYDFFQRQLLRHSVQRPPFSEAVFNLQDSKQILDYALATYFRHFKLYKHVFASQQRLNIHFSYTDESVDTVAARQQPPEQPSEPVQQEKEAAADDHPTQPPATGDQSADASDADVSRSPPATAVPEVAAPVTAAAKLKAMVEAKLAAKLDHMRAEMEAKIAKQNDELASTLSELEAKVMAGTGKNVKGKKK